VHGIAASSEQGTHGLKGELFGVVQIDLHSAVPTNWKPLVCHAPCSYA
jgi:hypothetical protein